MFRPTGEAFCEPSCELSNGGCPEGTLCRLRTVFCVRAPCPPVVDCVEPTGESALLVLSVSHYLGIITSKPYCGSYTIKVGLSAIWGSVYSAPVSPSKAMEATRREYRDSRSGFSGI